ncbi:hypothetical protein GlitD10_1287, partial [Gloeomargarita lithophora Alchichica-D10]
MATPR